MHEALKNNLFNYLNKDAHKGWFLITSMVIVLISIIVFTYKIEVYNVWSTKAITNCSEDICLLEFYLPTDKNLEIDFVKINNNSYNVLEEVYGEVVLDSANSGYQTVTLKLEEYLGEDQKIVELKIMENKENISKKIINKIVERS